MLLDRVAIKNYRSIKELEITFDPKCRILVGINESGKTNILNALDLLEPKKTTTQRDLREPGLREDPITEAHVRFIFRFTREEISELTDEMKKLVLSESYSSPIVKIDATDYTLDRFCETREGLYIADVLKNTKGATTWNLGKAQIINGWKKVGPACPPNFLVSSRKSGAVPLTNFALVNTSDFPTIPAEYFVEASAEDLRIITTNLIKQKVQADLLKVLFWDYDERNLLPPKVNLDQFCANPDICLPLKRMFQLHKIRTSRQLSPPRKPQAQMA